ncbi:MAG: OmpA family protein [Chthoniobacter sp.]|nr:OmpA family protein [Chthoniobacter sp.]
MLTRTPMARYESYQSNAAEAPLMRKWVVRALVASLFLHAALFVTFNFKKLENFGATDAPVLAPMPVNMKRAVIPILDEKDTRLELPKANNLAKLEVPVEKPVLEEIRMAPQAPDLTKLIGVEKPATMKGWDALEKAEQASRKQMDGELNAIAGALIKESPKSARQPLLRVNGNKPGEGGGSGLETIPGLPSVSDLLGEPGSLKSGVRGGIPGGALFEHGSAELRDAAVTQLQKLGELIKRNPNATFVIEGHTDSTGKPETNQALSEERADAVRTWLVEKMGIARERIGTVGMGSSKMIVDPHAYDPTNQTEIDAEIARQQPNRRVEIVIKTNRKER